MDGRRRHEGIGLSIKTNQIEIQKQVRSHLAVAAVLLTLTVVTVGISQLDLGTMTRVIIALAIATVQGGLIVGYLMHLRGEKRTVVAVLVLTGIFAASLLVLSVAGQFDTIEGTLHLADTASRAGAQDGGGH